MFKCVIILLCFMPTTFQFFPGPRWALTWLLLNTRGTSLGAALLGDALHRHSQTWGGRWSENGTRYLRRFSSDSWTQWEPAAKLWLLQIEAIPDFKRTLCWRDSCYFWFRPPARLHHIQELSLTPFLFSTYEMCSRLIILAIKLWILKIGI